ncbi:hypothetical protein ACWD3J_42910 [Streptomyces sp. NPDC002755]
MPEQPETEEAVASPQPATTAATPQQSQSGDLSDDEFMMTEVGDELDELPDR